MPSVRARVPDISQRSRRASQSGTSSRLRVDSHVSNTCVIRLHCPDPECRSLGAQSCAFDRLLEEMLKRGEEIKAIGETCHHSWSLSEAIKHKLRRILLRR
jgi:hypothetical protein